MRLAMRTSLAVLTVCVLSGCVAWPFSKRLQDLSYVAAPGMVSIAATARSIPLSPESDEETDVGRLIYRGGLHLTSPEARFGGFSGLHISADGTKLLAISDRAHWMAAHLTYDGDTLVDIENVTMAPLLDENGSPLRRPYYDAEGLTVSSGNPFDPDTDGQMLVSFETRDRVARYAFAKEGAAAKAVAVPMPKAIKQNKDNKGLEGIVRLEDGRLLAVTERTLDEAGNALGWIVNEDGSAQDITLKRKDPFELTDLARGPDGTIYTLERRFTRLAGPGMRIRAIDPAKIVPGAPVDGEEIAELDISYSIDNMEGLSIRQNADGDTLLYIISDNNGNSIQRTLLLMFELKS